MSCDEVVGLSFKLRGYKAHLRYMFERIPVADYTWYISESENFISTKGKIDLFLPDGVYSGARFANIVSSAEDYYIHLIRMFAVPCGMSLRPEEIDNFHDYTKSNAEIAFLSADSFVDLYVKNPGLLRNIVDSYECNTCHGKEPFEYITIQRDSRTAFHV